jgi:hypothetical protein
MWGGPEEVKDFFEVRLEFYSMLGRYYREQFTVLREERLYAGGRPVPRRH